MAPVSRLAASLALAALFVAQSSAHFILNYPPNVGFDEDKEPTGPCGGFTADFSNTTDFHVGGSSILLTSAHPTITFLYRATTDQTAMGSWQNLLNPVQVNGLGFNCNPLVPAPANFSGKTGLIQVIADSPDGILYQCAAVKFVDGAGPTGGSNGCTNATGVTMSYVTDSKLNVGSNSSSVSGSASSTTPSAAASSTKSSAGTTVVPMTYGAVGTVAWIMAIAVGTGAMRLL
ncbi:hypothetical protein BT63DRAFT_480035 [Microthyrium microscopicum]|uniref:Copper acquisition factor BIM1-like domain-containing protein n=1 Tax=Microthyrium microscopicum TaxID=703497 RepID=A0A6A6UBE0_9PEZI|nr:hypothetical protein BT63DRAFT_480035 [Microthyrium microscopicum]